MYYLELSHLEITESKLCIDFLKVCILSHTTGFNRTKPHKPHKSVGK